MSPPHGNVGHGPVAPEYVHAYEASQPQFNPAIPQATSATHHGPVAPDHVDADVSAASTDYEASQPGRRCECADCLNGVPPRNPRDPD